MPTIRDRAGQAVRAIRAFHELGRRSLRDPEDRWSHGSRAAEAEAKKIGKSGEYVRKARAFADPVRGYDPAELAALCQSVRAHFGTFAGRGAAFGTTHVIRLLAVPKGKRARMQEELFAGGWSTAELEAQIRRRFGRRRQGGRRRRPARDRGGLLAQADLVSRSWLRWFEQVGRPEAVGGTRTPLGRLPAPVLKAVEAAAKALAAVRDAVSTELD